MSKIRLTDCILMSEKKIKYSRAFTLGSYLDECFKET